MFSVGGRIQMPSGGFPAIFKVTMHMLLAFHEDAKKQDMQDTGWADGLRGIAAIFVVSSHLVLCYARGLVLPCCAPDSNSPSLFQRPIFRLVASGHSWVALFFTLMGFVNALKPIKMARAGEAASAANKLALSSFSRIFRLVIPATAATVLSWAFCQLGLYAVARESEAYWLYMNTPKPSSSVHHAVIDLKDSIILTWMLARDNPYDQPQWALIYLLQGSMMVILALLVTITMKPIWRTAFLLLFAVWSVDWSLKMDDPWVGITCFIGIILAEFNISKIPISIAPFSFILTPMLAILGLTLMSFPTTNVESAPWSAALLQFGIDYLIANNSGSMDRTLGSLGGLILVFSIVISPHARWLLSRKPFLWLGKVSFAIYLLHGMVIRTVFAWVMFIGQERLEYNDPESMETVVPTEWLYPLPGTLRCWISTIVAGVVILGASELWNTKMEPIFARITSWVEKIACPRKEQVVAVTVLTDKDMVLPTRQD